MLPDSTYQQGMLGMRNDSRTDMCTACSMSCSATVPTLTAYKHHRGADAAAGCCISSFKLHCTPQLSGRQQGCHRVLCRCSASLSLHHPCCLQCCSCLLHQFRVAVSKVVHQHLRPHRTVSALHSHTQQQQGGNSAVDSNPVALDNRQVT